MIRNIVLDIHGVLVHTRFNKYIWEHRLTPVDCLVLLKLTKTKVYEGADLGSLKDKAETAEALSKAYPEYKKRIEKLFRDHGWNSAKKESVVVSREIEKLSQDYAVYLLSNLDYEELALIRTMQFNKYISGGVYSCEEGCAKPDKELYQRLLDKYNLKAEECVFVDDKIRNVRAAESAGYNGVYFPFPSAGLKRMKKTLKENR